MKLSLQLRMVIQVHIILKLPVQLYLEVLSFTGLTLTSGTLTPAFNKGIYEYSGTVDNSVTSIGVTPTAEDVNATITVNGKKVPSGATSPYISLDEGGNTINVKSYRF